MPDFVQNLFAMLDGRKKIALYGDLGAGKTTFSKEFCKQLGVKQTVSSPTFSIINEYVFTEADGAEGFVYHIDLYRLKNMEEVFEIGLEDLLYEDAYFLIEWPQIAEPILHEDFYYLYIETLLDGSRLFSVYEAPLG